MQIPSIPDYNSILFSGCTIELANQIEDGKIYGPVLEYELVPIRIMSVFNFIVKKVWGLMYNYPITHTLQHLSSDEQIDYLSFHSLN